MPRLNFFDCVVLPLSNILTVKFPLQQQVHFMPFDFQDQPIHYGPAKGQLRSSVAFHVNGTCGETCWWWCGVPAPTMQTLVSFWACFGSVFVLTAVTTTTINADGIVFCIVLPLECPWSRSPCGIPSPVHLYMRAALWALRQLPKASFRCFLLQA